MKLTTLVSFAKTVYIRAKYYRQMEGLNEVLAAHANMLNAKNLEIES